MLKPWPLALAVALAAGLPLTTALADSSEQQQALTFDLPAASLGATLNAIARQSGQMVSLDPALVSGKQAAAIRGTISAPDAMRQALAGSGLRLVVTEGGSFSVVAAGDSADALELGPTTVTGSQSSATTEGTGSYAARGATLMKGSQSLKDIPQTITVMTRQQMDDQRLDTVDEVLSRTPGITLRRRPGGGSDIISRGFETNTIQYDGVPLPRAYTNGNMLSQSSVYLDRIEVLRGAQGLLEGAGSPAGAVNLIRKRGLTDHALSIEGRAGSWDNYGTRLDAGAPLDEEGTLRSRIVLDYEDKGSFLDKVWDRNLNSYAAIDFDATPDTTIGLGVAYSRLKGNSSLYHGIPRYADGTAVPLPRKANLDAAWANAIRRETQLFFDIEHHLNPDWKLKAAGTYINEEYNADTAFSYLRVIPIGSDSMSAPGISFDYGGKSKGLDINLIGELEALGISHELVIGGNYSNQDRKDAFDEYSNTTISIFDYRRDIPSLDSRLLTRKRDLTLDTTSKGLYSILRSHVTDRTTLILGGRVSWHEHNDKITNPLNGATISNSHTKETGEFTPYAGLVYALTPEWSAYVSYAEIFEPQSVTDAQFKVLPPMTGVNYEAGIKGELFDGALNTALAVYRIEQKDRAVTDYDSPMECAGWYCSRAAGKVRSEGFDIEAHGKLTRGWQISAGYTYNRNKYLEDEDPTLVGKPFHYEIPKHMLRLWSDYQLPADLSKWSIGAGVNYRSKQKIDSDTIVNPIQGGYSIWNARVSYDIDKNWDATLNIENLFDKKYYSSIPGNALHNYVGEPRNFLLTVRYTF